MTVYMDYIRAGNVLIAPSVEYDTKYILKCNECDEYYDAIESFWTHCIEHYGLEPKTENVPPLPLNDQAQTVEDYNFSTASVYNEDEESDEPKINMINEDPLHSIKEETTIEEPLKEETEFNYELIFEDTNLSYSDDYQAEHTTEIIESENECSDGQEIQNRLYVRSFLKSNQNVIALIAAYKSIPQLWDLNYPNKLRKYEERAKSLQKIAEELRNVLDLPITMRQVSAIIIHLRLKYRERLKNPINSEPETSKKNDPLPLWIFQSLDFLKPFFKYKSYALLDSQQQELSSEQITHILGIYKRCPFLWDTNLMEHYCYNKRSEALAQMIKLIKVELDKEVDESDLKKYLQILNVKYARVKRNARGGAARSKDERHTYHQQLTFLDGHVGDFVCKECNKTFRGPIYLKEHMYNHDGIIPIHCPSCNHEFKTASAFMAHVRRHMGDLAQECKECGKKFLKPAELRIHMRSHTGDKPFFCELCGTSFRQQQSFLAHKRKHENKFVLFCPTCSKGFYTKTKMRTHMATHEDVRNFVCGTCSKAFKTKKTLQNHEFTHEEGLNHECNICGKMFKNKINLAHHKRTHTYKIKDLNNML